MNTQRVCLYGSERGGDVASVLSTVWYIGKWTPLYYGHSHYRGHFFWFKIISLLSYSSAYCNYADNPTNVDTFYGTKPSV